MRTFTTVLIFLAVSLFARGKEIISCAPEQSTEQKESKQDEVTTVKAGFWSDKSIWSNGKLPEKKSHVIIAHNVTIDVFADVCCVTVQAGKTFTFAPERNVRLSQDKSMKVLGTLVMKPNSGKSVIRFTSIDESKIQGTVPNGGMGMGIPSTDADPDKLDNGLWVLGAGKLDLKGSEKTSWTHASGSVKAGATSYTVEDASGWKIGDQIVIVPTDKPGEYPTNWNDKTGELDDNFNVKFEVRTIQKIEGNKVYFNMQLKYDHLVVSSAIQSSLGNKSRTWKPEVINLTRNVVITGTKDGYSGKGYEWQTNHRAHILINSTSPQFIKYVEGRYLGQERVGSNGRPEIITGRYGLHFHMSGDGSRGSIVEGCSFWKLGNRGYVPHASHGITFKDNSVFDGFGEGFFWDFQELTHNTTYDHNIVASTRQPGGGGSDGFLLGQGDLNVAINNVCVYTGNTSRGSAYHWISDNEGVWQFENNLAHSSQEGVNVWQNTSNLHTVVDFDSYNCILAISHGAYANGYIYYGGYHYNSPINLNAAGAQFINLYMDMAGLPYAVETQDSPVPGSVCTNNPFVKCVFRNYKNAAVELRSVHPTGHPDKSLKVIDLINSDFTGKAYDLNPNDDYTLKDGNVVRVQPVSGQIYQGIWSKGKGITNNINAFAPKSWGTGTGLKAEYYSGNKFNSFAFTRREATIRCPQFSYDPLLTPTGVSYLIPDNKNFSIRWTGQIEAQSNENYTFSIIGGGLYKIWLNGQLIIDESTPKDATSLVTYSKPVKLQAGVKYDFKVEHRAVNLIATIILNWQTPTMECPREVPVTQLYPNMGTQKSRVMAETETPTLTAKEATTTPALYNFPNPASTTTTIHYTLPAKYSAAYILITNSTGVAVKRIPVSGGNNVQVNVASFPSGVYRYGLYVDGLMTDNKQMLVAK